MTPRDRLRACSMMVVLGLSCVALAGCGDEPTRSERNAFLAAAKVQLPSPPGDREIGLACVWSVGSSDPSDYSCMPLLIIPEGGTVEAADVAWFDALDQRGLVVILPEPLGEWKGRDVLAAGLHLAVRRDARVIDALALNCGQFDVPDGVTLAVPAGSETRGTGCVYSTIWSGSDAITGT